MTSSRASALLGSRSPIDVLVVGGGPAGTAAALKLARLGKSVVVLERTRYRDWRPGESLAPAANAALAELGVGERLLALGWKRCFGIQACWGSDDPYALDFIFDPYGAGVQVERPGFDALLASAATDAGATLAVDTRLLRFKRSTGGWQVTIACSGRECHCRARFLVDATGRPAVIARRVGAKRQTIDRLVALVGLFQRPEHDDDSTLLLEAVEGGWWYSAPLTGALAVAFMTDADLIGAHGCVTPETFGDRLARARRTAARIGDYPLRQLRVRSAVSSWLRKASGEGWLAVGDAALAYDPLSGIGLTRAMDSGLSAAQALAAALDGDTQATARYALETAHSQVHYLRQRTEIYAREQRWPGSSFWARRASPSPRCEQHIVGRRVGKAQASVSVEGDGASHERRLDPPRRSRIRLARPR